MFQWQAIIQTNADLSSTVGALGTNNNASNLVGTDMNYANLLPHKTSPVSRGSMLSWEILRDLLCTDTSNITH